MKQIKFRLTAYTDPAGKRNDELPYKGNEDNFYVDADLSNDVQGEFSSDKVQVLSKQGCLLTVADGMGGANAGEVASKIAIDTVKEFFGKEKIKAQKFETAKQRAAYMEKLVVQASRNICKKAAADSACEGMGSTIIMGWLSGNELTVTWCGDSRAYVLRDGVLCQVSNDHSYVQQLVDEHKITRDEAFDHPYGNIITRSLGDPDKDAKADSITMKVYKGDIILVCSDGLSGVLRDSTIQDIINGNRDSMVACREALWEAAEKADWYDNVTAILCEVTEGEKLPAAEAAKWREKAAEQNGVILDSGNEDPGLERLGKKISKKRLLKIAVACLCVLVLAAGVGVGCAYMRFKKVKNEVEQKCSEKNLETYLQEIERIGFGRKGFDSLLDIRKRLDSMQSVKERMDEMKPEINEYPKLHRKLNEIEREMLNPLYDYTAKWDSVYGSFRRLQAIKSELDSITKDANEYIEKLRAKYKELSGQEFVSEAEAEAWSSLHSSDTSQADKKVKKDDAKRQGTAKAKDTKAKDSKEENVQTPRDKQGKEGAKPSVTDNIGNDRLTEIPSKDAVPDSGTASVPGKD